jgi:hypothetical protein
MAIKFNRSQTFATNGTVTAAGLHNLIDGTDIYQALITDQTAMTSVGSLDKLLIADSDLTAGDAPRSVTVNELFEDALTLSTYTNVNAVNLKYTSATGNYTLSTGATITNGTIANGTITSGTIPTLTAGTTTSTAANITNGTVQTLTASTANITTGTVATLNSTTGTITSGTIPTLTAGTTTSTAANITNGTVQTLTASTANITTGTVATFNSTTGTIASLSATTSTFLGTITGSTNVIDIGSGQIYKNAGGKVLINSSTEKSSVLSQAKLQIYDANLGLASNTDYFPQVNLISASTTAGAGPYFITGRSRGSIESPTAVQSGDIVGTVGFGGHDGTQLITSASISGFVDGAVSTNNVPTAAVITTGTAGGLERLRISSAGVVTIANLAGAGSRAVNASAAGVLSAASDLSLKEVIAGEHIAGLSEILQINPRVYKWKEDIAIRGENATKELGFIANEVAPIIPSAAPIGNDGLYGFYDRSITAALVKAVQELKAENDSLKSRIEAIEAK